MTATTQPGAAKADPFMDPTALPPEVLAEKAKVLKEYHDTAKAAKAELLAMIQEGIKAGDDPDNYPPRALVERGFELETRTIELTLPKYVWAMNEAGVSSLPDVTVSDVFSNLLVNRFLKDGNPLIRVMGVLSGLLVLARPEDFPEGSSMRKSLEERLKSAN